MKPKIGILTNFNGADSAFSLVNVVHTQLDMLLAANYAPVLYVAEHFQGEGFWDGRRFEIRRAARSDAGAEDIAASLRDKLDVDVMLCHDIFFLSQNAEWAASVRALIPDFPHIAWLHWQHSRGGHSPIEAVERSWFCYPNMGDLPHVAQLNNAPLERVRYIPHPLDLEYLGWPALALKIAEDFNFPFVDIAGILPARLDRQKQVEKAVRVFAGLKRAGKSVCFLVADAFATGERFKEYKTEVERIARGLGLSDKEFAFLGERYEECMYATPRPVVKALFEMANLFIQPSNSETSSLIAMEAALAGNLLILNADFKPIHHLYEKALTLPFGSIFEDTKYFRHVKTADGKEIKLDDPQAFFDDQARQTIIPVLDTQIVQAVKRQQFKDRWPSEVFSNYLEPLIMEAWEEVRSQAVEVDRAGDPEITAIITGLDNRPMLERQIPILLAECGQVIVVNNGSKDDTAEWLAANPHPRLRYINRENKGAGPGRNAGLDLWAGSTPYTLMVDGGILPPIGGAAKLKDYLTRHPEVDVISPELESCFTTDENAVTYYAPNTVIEETFPQRALSSTAYCLCRAHAWEGLRFSEEGPFGMPGWGVDDNEMAYRWDEAGIMHRDFTHSVSGWALFRRQSGSWKRLFEETGVWPNQYGSVFEQRCVKTHQDWRAYYSPASGWAGTPIATYIIDGVPMPEFARLVKKLRGDEEGNNIDVIASDYDPEVKRWLDTFALRWPWGNCAFDPDGTRYDRGVNYPEELWSGHVVRNRGPIPDCPVIVTITPENLHEYLEAEAVAA